MPFNVVGGGKKGDIGAEQGLVYIKHTQDPKGTKDPALRGGSDSDSSTLGISWCCAEARGTVAYTVVMVRQIPLQNPFLESAGLKLDCAL